MNEAWQARNHEAVTTRSRRGVTSQRITRYGVATVRGAADLDSDGRPLLARSDDGDIAGRLARALAGTIESGQIRLRWHGMNALDVTALTDLVMADDPEFPALLSTDVRQHAQIVRGDRSSYCPVAYRTGSLTDAVYGLGVTVADLPATLAAIVAPAGAYGAHTDDLDDTSDDMDTAVGSALNTRVPWRARVRLPRVQIRKSEVRHFRPRLVWSADGLLTTYGRWQMVRPLPAATTGVHGHTWWSRDILHGKRGTVVVSLTDGKCWQTISGPHFADVTTAPTMFAGHATITREQTARRGTRKQQRTIGTIDQMPATIDGWSELAANLNRGERVQVGQVTITRSQDGRYRATDRRPGREQTVAAVRTITTLATRLAD